MFSCSVMPSSLQGHELWPASLLCLWDFKGKNAGVSSHSLLQGIFPTQESNPGLLHCRQILHCQPARKPGSSHARDQIHVSCPGKWLLNHWTTQGSPTSFLLACMGVKGSGDPSDNRNYLSPRAWGGSHESVRPMRPPIVLPSPNTDQHAAWDVLFKPASSNQIDGETRWPSWFLLAETLTWICGLLIQDSLTLQEIISGVNASDPELCFQATQAARYHQTDLYHWRVPSWIPLASLVSSQWRNTHTMQEKASPSKSEMQLLLYTVLENSLRYASVVRDEWLHLNWSLQKWRLIDNNQKCCFIPAKCHRLSVRIRKSSGPAVCLIG